MNEVTTTKMEGPGQVQQVRTKDPKKVAAGNRSTGYNRKKRAELAKAQKREKANLS